LKDEEEAAKVPIIIQYNNNIKRRRKKAENTGQKKYITIIQRLSLHRKPSSFKRSKSSKKGEVRRRKKNIQKGNIYRSHALCPCILMVMK